MEELTLAKEKEKEESFKERKKQHLASNLKDLQTDSEDKEHENEQEEDIPLDGEIKMEKDYLGDEPDGYFWDVNRQKFNIFLA